VGVAELSAVRVASKDAEAMSRLGNYSERTRVGVAELSAVRVASKDAEAMSRLGNYSDFSVTFSDFQ